MIRFQLSVAMLLSLTFLCSANADEQWMHSPPPADMANGKKVVLKNDHIHHVIDVYHV